MLVIDTYALIEWFVYGNVKYKKYFERIDVESAYISKLVLMEFYCKIFHETEKELAEELLNVILTRVETIDLTVDRIKKTAEKRSEMLKKKKKLSYADCLNIVIAEEKNARVLTGDKEFKEMDHVEFVK